MKETYTYPSKCWKCGAVGCQPHSWVAALFQLKPGKGVSFSFDTKKMVEVTGKRRVRCAQMLGEAIADGAVERLGRGQYTVTNRGHQILNHWKMAGWKPGLKIRQERAGR